MTSSPVSPLGNPPNALTDRGLIAVCLKLGILAIGYVLFAGLIVALERLGSAFNARGWGIVGLGIDVILLSAAVTWLGLKRHPWATSLTPLLGLLLVFLIFAVGDWWLRDLSGGFWTLRNVQTIAAQSATIAVAALGMTMLIISGGIDLSVGTAAALCSVVFAWCLNDDRTIKLAWLGDAAITLPGGLVVALLALLVTGLLCGAINGALTSLLRVVPFIITLGTMTIFLGMGKLLAGSSNVRPPTSAVPEWLGPMVAPQPDRLWLAWPLLPNFAWGVWFVMGLALVTAGILHGTVFGRYVYALGSNEATARLCGINVPRTKILVYTLAGVFVGLAGLFMFARLKEGEPTGGGGLELRVIAAVVIGGGSLSGGRGSVVGALTGAAIMPIIEAGCTSLRFPNPLQDIALGAIIIVAVAFDRWRQRTSED